ncbi:MAG: hypothetical protein WCF18_20530, partial [Chthoniobacteraceae bacterium]
MYELLIAKCAILGSWDLGCMVRKLSHSLTVPNVVPSKRAPRVSLSNIQFVAVIIVSLLWLASHGQAGVPISPLWGDEVSIAPNVYYWSQEESDETNGFRRDRYNCYATVENETVVVAYFDATGPNSAAAGVVNGSAGFLSGGTFIEPTQTIDISSDARAINGISYRGTTSVRNYFVDAAGSLQWQSTDCYILDGYSDPTVRITVVMQSNGSGVISGEQSGYVVYGIGWRVNYTAALGSPRYSPPNPLFGYTYAFS